MHISPERFITTLQYPLAPPLPLLTEGCYPNKACLGACATLSGRALDSSITAITRLVATPLLVASGAARWGWHGAHHRSISIVPLMLVGVVLGAALGAAGAAKSLGDMLLSGVGLVVLVIYLTGCLMGSCVWQMLSYFVPALACTRQTPDGAA